jgi:hypothetical protein
MTRLSFIVKLVHTANYQISTPTRWIADLRWTYTPKIWLWNSTNGLLL